MAKHQIQIEFDHYATEQELPLQTVALLDEAKKALDQAYAPYSGFQVGAAILMANREIVTGSNQENAAYPSGMCAERTAVYFAGSRFPGVPILEIVVVARKKGEAVLVPACPCGSCRQALMEYEERQSQPIRMVFKQKAAGFLGLASVGDSLPFKFGADALGH